MNETKNNPSIDLLAPYGSAEARVCVVCGVTKPIDDFQRSGFGGTRASDCKACRYLKMRAGRERKSAPAPVEPATKEWVIAQATLLYHRAVNDAAKAKYLDLISRNLNGDAKNLTDDSKVLRDLIASKKRLKEEAAS